ncbi:MAG TPA: hypothetical protein DEQ38_14145 [Elusimicrobia bacterium]|nr:MAG: hypothetical protein A2089_07145 [Elusimicrobia bacterium GWD2_63_28]HCC49238.1 hypothetical protein [Elusimicrobiota bacterium]
MTVKGDIMERLILTEKRRLRAGRRACLFACLAALLAVPSQAQYVFYNADNARIETTNSFWVGTGLLGGDGGLSIGYAGTASPAGGAIFAANVGIGDSTPAALLTVGAGDKFRVDSAGNLIRINNIAYSWPAAQGGAATFLQNDGAGNLTWALTPGDNLGNHLATQNLNLNTFNIFGAGSITANAAITTYSSMTVAGNGGTYGLAVSSNITAAAGLFNTVNGKVGIGTAAPGYGLEVISPTGVYFATATTANDGLYFSPKGMLAVGGKNAWDQDPKARLHIVSTGTYDGTYLLMSKYRSYGGTGTAAVKFYDYGDAALMEIGYTGLTTGKIALNGGASAMGSSILLYNHAAVAAIGLVSNGNTYFNGGAVSIGTNGTARGKLDVYGIDSEIFVGNNAGQAGIIGNSRRLNYGDVLLARNLQGTSGSDAYRTKDATTGGGYAGVELKHSGDVAIYGQNGDTTAGAAVTPTARLFIKGDSGAVGLGRTAPNAALDVVSTGTASNVYAQIWRASDGTVVSSVSATGMLTVKDSAHFATASGNVGIGTNSPGAKFTIGNNQFQVNATGNLVKVNNIAYSWPAAQGAASTILRNDGAGNLSWASLSADNLGNHTATQDLNMAGFDITGAGYFEGSVYRRDLRTIAPSDETSGTMRFGFTAWGNNGAAPYADFLHLRSYTDATGGKDNLLMIRKDAIGLRLWQQDWNSATPYAAYKDFAFTDASNASGTWPNADTLDLLHKTSFGASLDTSGNNVRLLNSDGTQLSSITPPYATNADTVDLLHKTSFGASLDTSGNNVRLLNSDGTQLTSVTPPYATNSDTVDSLHATDFLRKVAAIDGNTLPDSLSSGQYWSPIYANNYPTSYGHLLTLKGGTGASVTQLALGWPGSDGGDSGLWVRARRDGGSNIWGSWSKVWNDRNDGSGSLLDADQLDGLHKTSFGASLDTSGNNVRLLNSDGTQLTSITPPYATNADTVDGLHAHAGTNNEANKLVRTDGNGYIQAGWLNTPSGDAGTNAIAKIYGTYASDNYVRYYTLANLASQVRGLAAWNAAVANDYPVAQVLRWKNYGVSHVIFDASNGTAPDGTAHNNTNPEVAWSASYPTLMGYNGANTYGVRVSNAGYADTAGGAPPTGAAGGVLSGNYPNPGFANNASYPVSAADGNGLKFWNGSDAYKVSMGNAGEYHYGPVTDYSIKTAIDSNGATRGFTWGTNGGTPVGALNVGNGNFEVAGTIRANGGTIYNGNATRRWVTDGAWNYFHTDYGNIRLGPANATWAHIYADLPFYFNQQLYVNGTQVVTNSGSWNITAANVSALAGTWTGINYFQSNLGTTLGALSNPPLQVYATGTNAAFMSFHRGGSYAVNMGLDSDNVFRIGGWSAAANRLQLDMSGNLTTAGGLYPGGNVYIDDNYGLGVVGLYDSTRYQGVFAMGDSYKLAADGTTPGTLYGIAWTHTNVGGQSKAGLGHQALFMENGVTQTAIGNGIWTRADITASGSLFATNDYYNANTAYGRIGSSFYADTINTGVAGDPLELNYVRSGDVRFVGGDQTMALNRVVYPGSVSGLSDYQKNYYLASHASWGLYTNTSLNAQGGLYDVGSRVAISRAEGRNYVDYSRYVYNNGAYSGSGWTEPSDLGVRYASNSGTSDKVNGVGASPDASHPGTGLRPFYSWNTGCANNGSGACYSNGISVGSHPGDQAYGFQIVSNMWDDNLYFRRYNSGWQSWKTVMTKSYYHRGCIANASAGCAPAACASGDTDLSYYCQSAIYVAGSYWTYYCERTCCRGSD